MSEDRNRSGGDDAAQKNKDAIVADRSAGGQDAKPGAKTAIAGNADGRDAALRSDTDRPRESPGGIRNSRAPGADLPPGRMPDSAGPGEECPGRAQQRED